MALVTVQVLNHFVYRIYEVTKKGKDDMGLEYKGSKCVVEG